MSAKRTDPNRAALYAMLTQGDHTAAALLARICYWEQWGKAKIKGVEGTWIANPVPWWRVEAALSLKQYSSSIAKLAKLGLIEKRQHPFGGKGNILHVRPSGLTRDFMTAAKTWDVAVELLNHVSFPVPKHLASHCQVTPSMAQMQEVWGEHKLTAEEIGKLAVYRLNMNAVLLKDVEYDLTRFVLPLIKWAKANWGKISTKEAPVPSLAHFCDGLFMKALDEADFEEAELEKELEPI